MIDTRKYRIYPNDLSIGAAYEAICQHLQRCGYTEQKESYCPDVGYTVHLSDERTLRTHTSQEFLELLKQYHAPQSTSMHCHWKKMEAEVQLLIGLGRSFIEVTVSADDLTTIAGLHDKISELFQARNPPVEKGNVSRYDLKPTIFLAHRFDEAGRNYAETLGRFLRLLGFEVLEGEGYEARDIPAKVAERIRSQDIFLCLVSEGDPTWILSEAAFAKGLSKYIVILVQDGLRFKKGIVGTDYEHLTFPKGLIEKTYSDLLYALPIK